MSQAAQRKAALKRRMRQNRKRQRVKEADHGKPFQPPAPGPSPSLDPPAVDLTDEEKHELLRSFDGLAGLRGALAHIAAEKGEWAGIPMLLDDLPLVIEPTYPYAGLANFHKDKEAPPDPALPKQFIRNIFWSHSRRSDIVIFTEGSELGPGVPVYWGVINGANHVAQEILTLGASDAWSIESESNALQTLATMLSHRQFKQYLLTGSFLWTSPKSRVKYLFRKLRPTIAMANDGKGNMRVLCTCCLHPIAYYQGSWGGALCPTDDVLSHFCLARGDEHMFWRRANQHPPWSPNSGL